MRELLLQMGTNLALILRALLTSCYIGLEEKVEYNQNWDDYLLANG